MDVKARSSKLLSQGVPASAASPVTRVIDGYVDVRQPKPAVSDSEEKRESVVRSECKALCKESVGVPKVHTLLAGLGLDPASAEQLLRQELLRERNSFSGRIGTDAKRFYTATSYAAAAAATETTTALCRPVGGTALDSRTDNVIKLHKLVIHWNIERLWGAAPTAVVRYPIHRFVVWRDKIPSTPGTAPTVFATDADPPVNTTCIYTRLGVAAGAGFDSIAQRNPNTLDEYHVYYDEKHMVRPNAPGFDANDGKYHTQSGRLHGKIIIDLHKVQQQYASYTATEPLINDLYITTIPDQVTTNMGFADYVNFTSEVTFDDVQV